MSVPFLLNIPIIGKLNNSANNKKIPTNLEFRSFPMADKLLLNDIAYNK